MSVSVAGDALNSFLGQLDYQQAVIPCVIAEDVGERRRQDDAETKFTQRPGRMLARGSAAEVLAGNQYRRVTEVAPG